MGKPDTLSRRPDFAEGSKAAEAEPRTVIKPSQLSIMALTVAPQSDIATAIKPALHHDPVALRILNLCFRRKGLPSRERRRTF